jgi:hypothetical protein
VERYTQCFARVITLHEQGLNLTEIAFVVQISEALSQQYLDLYRQYNTAKYRQRLDEIIGKARGALSFSKDADTPKKREKEVQ